MRYIDQNISRVESILISLAENFADKIKSEADSIPDPHPVILDDNDRFEAIKYLGSIDNSVQRNILEQKLNLKYLHFLAAVFLKPIKAETLNKQNEVNNEMWRI